MVSVKRQAKGGVGRHALARLLGAEPRERGRDGVAHEAEHLGDHLEGIDRGAGA